MSGTNHRVRLPCTAVTRPQRWRQLRIQRGVQNRSRRRTGHVLVDVHRVRTMLGKLRRRNSVPQRNLQQSINAEAGRTRPVRRSCQTCRDTTVRSGSLPTTVGRRRMGQLLATVR
uniref:(northern house mosquito) hypothetical protein n=1 Tax=Culex pipiens TaxID=7175 RepID=A0A8D8CXS3_CULPI